jgi:hypothetical protein
MLLERIHNLRFLQIQTVKALDIVHGGLYRWKVVSFSQGLVRELQPLA